MSTYEGKNTVSNTRKGILCPVENHCSKQPQCSRFNDQKFGRMTILIKNLSIVTYYKTGNHAIARLKIGCGYMSHSPVTQPVELRYQLWKQVWVVSISVHPQIKVSCTCSCQWWRRQGKTRINTDPTVPYTSVTRTVVSVLHTYILPSYCVTWSYPVLPSVLPF